MLSAKQNASNSPLLGRRRIATNWRGLNSLPGSYDLLHCDTLGHALHRVLALKFVELVRRVLIQELIDGKVTTTDLDEDLSTLDLDTDALLTEVVNAV